ncbi:MAG TPA: 50S ribosomal protein L10 [Planctomycetes bacterium]|nr:50S ribosomal protein L10 [Planctomycetota bacterium]
MPNMINRLLHAEFEKEFKDKGAYLVLNMSHLKAEDAHALRGRMEEKGTRFRVVKNRLARLALEKNGLGELGGYLQGQCAIIYGDEEETAIQAAKIAAAFMEGETIPPEKAQNLHTLPDKATLRAQLVGAIQGPMRGLAAVLAGPGASLARAINARAEGE